MYVNNYLGNFFYVYRKIKSEIIIFEIVKWIRFFIIGITKKSKCIEKEVTKKKRNIESPRNCSRITAKGGITDYLCIWQGR